MYVILQLAPFFRCPRKQQQFLSEGCPWLLYQLSRFDYLKYERP